MIERPIIVFLSGNNASGKTTLGRKLAEKLGWLHLPEEKFNQTYLDDLFSFERRWSFEAQLHFLSHKVGTINSCSIKQRNALIDRSPHEDARVFAEHFYSLGQMDKRAILTYRQVAQQFLASLPLPDLFIYCHAPLNELKRRVTARHRGYERNYPPNHLELIDLRYRTWLAGVIDEFPNKVLSIDSSRFDFLNDDTIVQAIADDVVAHLEHLSSQESRSLQASLFAPSLLAPGLPKSIPCGLTEASYINPFSFGSTRILSLPSPDLAEVPREHQKKMVGRPHAYVAAPFTSRASVSQPIVEPTAADPSNLLGLVAPAPAPHGILPQSYRNELLALERVVRDAGFATKLPHRDVNRWGNRILTAQSAIQECTKAIRQSDILVAIPDGSYGVHYEVGVAAGIGIPLILLKRFDEDLTFLMSGIESLPNAHIVSYRDWNDLEFRLKSTLTQLPIRPDERS